MFSPKTFITTIILTFSLVFSIATFGQTYATLPFSDDLSSGSLGSQWSFSDVQGIGTYSVSNLSGGWPNFGTCSSGICSNVGASSGNGLLVYNSSAPTGSNQLNMDLHLDLDGKGAVELQQAIVDWRSGYDSIQVSLSNDGGSTFTRATVVKLWLAPYSDGIWNELTLDISALAAATGVSFTDEYVVRYSTFLQYIGSATNPKNWPNQSVYMDNFKGTEIAALPVEMSSFSGINSAEGTTLVWSTLSEVNNSHFEIQRSVDGKVWNTIGQVEGAGNSQSELNYEFLDGNVVNEISYYRIKQVDFDGAFKYSNTISFNSGSAEAKLTVMSNGKAPIVSVNGIENAEIQILSMMGKEVWSKESIEGYWLDLDFLPNGHYLVMVNTGEGFISEKVIVMK